LNISPKNIVLLIGTNDISRGVPLSVTVENVSKIIENAKSTCPNVNFILQAVYPINRGMRDKFEKRSNDKIHLMNKEFIKLCEKYNCAWLDLTDQLKDETGNLRKEYTYDGLHLNISAYKIIAEKIIPLLK
ncbi:MAG: GDSL family lipase, partial [Clostridia bacterium]|nr:GDSL family lipase [Clostridia bacterium]